MPHETERHREGSLEAPIRHPVKWKEPAFYDEDAALKEMERVFDICHGCRRCVSLCNAFPTLFDLVDASSTLEIDGVAKPDYYKVVDHCYLCDLCYMTKCPYVPPHEWNVDFPHLMLRAKAIRYEQGKSRLRDRLLTSTDAVGRLAGIPVVAEAVNAVNGMKPARRLLDKLFGIHADAPLPEFHSRTLRKRRAGRDASAAGVEATEATRGRVALFATCYCNRNAPDIGEDLIAVFEHNDLPLRLTPAERCCGMPKLELGDLETIEKLMRFNIPRLAGLVDEGWDLVAPVPSCVLMFKHELPLLFPEDEAVRKVGDAFFDPFEYLLLRHKAGRLRIDFKNPLGKVACHVPCHQRVQNIGLKTREILQLVPGTTIDVIERCSGHDGTYAVKSEFHDISMKICRPVVNKVKQAGADHYISDCPMAARQIQEGVGNGSRAESPFSLLRRAYGI
ncbi:MAG: Fe-S oxidoreductase [Gammaproteobacteria bacterium]|nr:Fe-S oxidoreductase [Gammaproteobacteria bacterium]